MSKATRLAGIDLCCELAVFAVISVHSGDETWGYTDQQPGYLFSLFILLCGAVFLAKSLCFSTKNYYVNSLYIQFLVS